MSKLYSICREREREDLLKQRSIEKSTKEQWLKELTDIMNRLGVKSNVKEAHKQITHIQEESAKYKLLSESMMAQMGLMQKEMNWKCSGSGSRMLRRALWHRLMVRNRDTNKNY